MHTERESERARDRGKKRKNEREREREPHRSVSFRGLNDPATESIIGKNGKRGGGGTSFGLSGVFDKTTCGIYRYI